MKIDFERSGGFAGMRQAASVDSEQLPPEEADALQKEVESAGFFQLPAKLPGTGAGADQFQYKVTVELGGRRHTVEVDESGVPPSLQPLLQRLSYLARTSRGSLGAHK